MALTWKFTTTTGAVAARLVANGAGSILNGISATNNEGTTVPYFIKLFWEGTGTPPPTVAGGTQPATVGPVAGTTIPSMVIEVPSTGLFYFDNLQITNGGRMWFWVSLLQADTDTTVITIGGEQITFIYG